MTWRTKIVRVAFGVTVLASTAVASGADFVDFMRRIYHIFHWLW
jgi:hypothetical protein